MGDPDEFPELIDEKNPENSVTRNQSRSEAMLGQHEISNDLLQHKNNKRQKKS